MRRIAFFQGAGCGGGGACAGVVGLRLRCAGRQAFARRRAGGSRRPQGGSSCVGVCRSSGGDDCLFAVKANRPGSAILIMAMDAPSWERQIRRIAPGQNENCWAGFDVRRRRFLRRCFPPAPSAVPGSASPQVPADPPPDIEYAETVEKGRGRIEVRRLALSCEVVPHLRWPGAARVCRIERICERAGKTSRAVSRAVIGLPPRPRRGIENRRHYRRDVALREDSSRIRAGNAPQALAALRNAMLRLVHSLPGSLAAIRAAFAEDRPHAIATAKYGLL